MEVDMDSEQFKNLRASALASQEGKPAFNPSLFRVQYSHFFFALCTEDAVTATIQQAEDMGCDFVSLFPVMVPVQSSLAIPGKPQMVPAYRVFVRCVRSEFADIQKRMQGAQDTMNKAGRN